MTTKSPTSRVLSSIAGTSAKGYWCEGTGGYYISGTGAERKGGRCCGPRNRQGHPGLGPLADGGGAATSHSGDCRVHQRRRAVTTPRQSVKDTRRPGAANRVSSGAVSTSAAAINCVSRARRPMQV